MTSQVSHSSNQRLIALNAKAIEKRYWMGKLSEIKQAGIFPSSLRRGESSENRQMAMLRKDIDQVLSQKLLSICNNDSALLVFLITGLNVQLFKYLSVSQIAIGTTIMQAAYHESALNTLLPMHVAISGSMSFRDILSEVKEQFVQSQNHQDYPVRLLFDKIATDKDVRLFRTALVLDNIQNATFLASEQPDLIFRFSRQHSGLSCKMEYNASMFSDVDVQSVINNYQALLLRCVSEPDKPLNNIEAVSDDERKQILKINETKTTYDRDSSIHHEFERQVKLHPEKIAVTYHEVKLTYKELDRRANNLAAVLKQVGVSLNSNVVILQEMSTNYIISILATLKAGGVYVPIAPQNPSERIKYLLKDIDAGVVLATRDTITLAGIDAEVTLKADNSERRLIYVEEAPNDETLQQTSEFDLAYILFTSGSTGKPKGVMISHRNVLRLVKGTSYVKFSEETNILLTGSPTFDATTFEIWGSLLNGGHLTLVDKEVLIDAEKLEKEITDNRINTLWLTSPLFNRLVDQDRPEMFSGLKYLLVGGDALSPKHINKVRSRNKELKVINGYGPTENTTFSLTKEVDSTYEFSIPIGKPIQNSTAYVLGESLDLKPVLGIGILYVGGDGVTRGYLNNEELNKEKLIKNPFGNEGYLYRTDDVVYLRSDGDIEFIGRADNQVKIRGFRIELGEIENQLAQIQGVENGLVLVREDTGGEKYLCAYYTWSEVGSSASVKAALETYLPDYMIPRHFILIDEFPLTPHGKIDMAALPLASDLASVSVNETFDEVEQKLALLWTQLLEINEKSVSRSSNFFEQGGHSLHATSMLSMIRKSFEMKISIPQLFSNPTLGALAALIRNRGNKEVFFAIPAADNKTYYQLSAAQRRMYILQQLNPESVAYNIFNIVRLKEGIDAGKIHEIFKQLINRHESLRTAFVKYEGNVYQHIMPEVDFNIEIIDDISLSLQEQVESFIRPFDLAQSPLVRAAIIKEEQSSLLLLDMHHIISDAVSQEILLSEFEALNAGLPLSDIRLQYKDVAEYQNSDEFIHSVKQDEEYWLNMFHNEPPILNLPYDFPRPKNRSFEGGELALNISDKTFGEVQRFCNERGITLHVFLLSVWSVVLSKYSAQRDIVVGLPVAGRKHHEMQSIVGMFVNTLALRCFPEADKKFTDYMSEIKHQVLEAFDHQDYQFEDLIEKLQLSRDTSRNPLFDVSFNLLRGKEGDDQLFDNEHAAKALLPKVAKFDLTLNVIDFGNSLRISLEYARALFNADTVKRIGTSFNDVLQYVLADPEIVLSQITVLSDLELDLLLNTFNSKVILTPASKGIHVIIEENIAASPHAIALIDKAGSITYRELGRLSDKLAVHLKEGGVRSGDVVGMSMGNIKEMTVAMLGILKAGAVLLPFDPLLPEARIAYMLKLTTARTIITQKELQGSLAQLAKLIFVEDLPNLMDNGHQIVPSERGGEDLAYVIFTSGTTGVPNGVKVSHRALINLCAWHVHHYEVTGSDRATKYASLSFDASMWEIFPYLYKGASIYFFENDIKLELAALNANMEKQGVTISFLPTQIGEKFNSLENRTLKKLLLGGDKLKKLKLTDCTYLIYNNYGPTENAVVTTSYKIGKELADYPIGKPVANTQVYVLRPESTELVPINVPGELCVSGDNLASGYLDENLTQISFVDNPFTRGEKLYRTGDMVKWLPDGNLEFIGRINDQVKIRGNRVELAEIEQQILTVADVEEAVVVLNKQHEGEGFLCSYYTSPCNVSGDEIRQHLLKRIPDYMIPLHIIKLEKLPLTTNGKIDKRRLPVPEISSKASYMAPENDLQQKLADIWSTILQRGKDQIGVNDNFFELGGNSLKAILLKDKIEEALDIELPVVSLFEFPTIRSLSKHLEQDKSQKEKERTRLEQKEKESLDVLNETLQALNL